MSTGIVAAGCAAQISATLNGTAYTLLRFQGTEGLSQLFRFQIEFLSATRLGVSDLINRDAVVTVESQISNSDPMTTRYFHGVINRFSYAGEATAPGTSAGSLSRYRAEIVPWLWFLTQRTNCRIFQSVSVTDILKSVLDEYGKSYATRFNETYTTHELRIQYRESDFAFLSRLMEESGIFYYFRHTAQGCELVLADNISGYFACDQPSLRFGSPATGSSGDHVHDWEHDYEFRPGAYSHTDFDFQNPTTDLLSPEQSLLNLPGASTATLYDYPGRFLTTTDGQFLARVRMQEQEASHEVVRGMGAASGMAPAAKFTMTGHPQTAESASEYVITTVEHEVSGVSGGLSSAAVTSYRNRFACIPATRLFRPPMITRRPVIPGTQSGIVTGPSDETVYVDGYGRVKVHFHWNQYDDSDENSSCWIRVSQAWAGSEFGSVLLPHVGQEVLVSFLEGDPDQPVVTGRVYNADNMPPERLPGNKHRAIVAQDCEGNIIALDADEKRVDIQNAQDKFELTVGESVTATAGMDVGITLGCGVGINLGAAASAGLAASFDVGLGISSSVFLGGSFDASFGGSFSWAAGNFVNAGDSVGQIAFKQDAEFVSHKSVALAGGSGTNNSVLLASSDGLTLSYGQTSPSFAGSPALALGLGVFGSAVTGTIGIAAAGATAYLGAKAAEKDDFSSYAGGTVASATSSVLLSGVAAGLLIAFARFWSQVKQPVHGGVLPQHSTLQLEQAGALLGGATDVTLMTGLGGQTGEVRVITDEFKVNAPAATMLGDLEVKGILKSPNIQDIGGAAVAAATRAAARAAVAARNAQWSAAAARHQARQAALSAAANR